MKIEYQIGVKTLAGWRSVVVVAEAVAKSKAMATVEFVHTIDGEVPSRYQSITGAKRQAFNGSYFARAEVGKTKRLSACTIVGDDA